jgi:FtsZ-binding cell division protein ZapB
MILAFSCIAAILFAGVLADLFAWRSEALMLRADTRDLWCEIEKLKDAKKALTRELANVSRHRDDLLADRDDLRRKAATFGLRAGGLQSDYLQGVRLLMRGLLIARVPRITSLSGVLIEPCYVLAIHPEDMVPVSMQSSFCYAADYPSFVRKLDDEIGMLEGCVRVVVAPGLAAPGQPTLYGGEQSHHFSVRG